MVKCVFVTKGSKSSSSNIDWLAYPSPGQLACCFIGLCWLYCNQELLVKKCSDLFHRTSLEESTIPRNKLHISWYSRASELVSHQCGFNSNNWTRTFASINTGNPYVSSWCFITGFALFQVSKVVLQNDSFIGNFTQIILLFWKKIIILQVKITIHAKIFCSKCGKCDCGKLKLKLYFRQIYLVNLPKPGPISKPDSNCLIF